MFKRITYIYTISFLFVLRVVSYGQEDVRFNHLNVEDGLPSNNIICMLQDDNGFIWIGTGGGLSRYDGNNAITFTHNENDSSSVCNSQIACLYEDNLHNLWIGTYFGLSKYNPLKKDFTNYYFDKWSTSMETSLISNIMQDNKGMLYVATGTGIFKADPANPHFTQVKSFTEDHYGFLIHGLTSMSNGRIFILMDTALLYSDDYCKSFKTAVSSSANGNFYFSELYYDKSDEHLWFGTYAHSAAFEFDPHTFKTKQYPLESPASYQSNFAAYDFCRLNDSIMLTGCLFGHTRGGGGVIFLNTKRNSFLSYTHHNENPFSLSSGDVWCLMKDGQNTFWIGTTKGLNNFNLRQLNFHWITSENCGVQGLGDFSIRQLCYDKNLWIGTLGDGLIEFNGSNQKFSWYKSPKSLHEKKTRNYVFSMYPDNNTLWLGVENGFMRFDINTHVFDTTSLLVPELKDLYTSSTRGIGKDNEGIYWIGTYNSGLFSYNQSTGKGVHYFDRKTNLTTKYRNYIKCMSIDKEGTKWVGTYDDGFCRIDARPNNSSGRADTNQISWNIPGDKKAMVMQRGWINDICCDSIGNTYIATQGDGLIIYEAKTKSFRTLRNSRLPEDNKINKIVEYRKGCLWLATGKGLSFWDLNTNTFLNYPEGKRIANMVSISGCVSPDGVVYFGGDNELLYFNPDKLAETSPYIHPEVTSLSVMNKDYISDINKPLFLSYKDNYVSFAFSAFDFLNEKGDRFAYYLEGFDKDWNYCGNRHFATYTNLPGGNYTFHLKVQNSSGEWVESSHPVIMNFSTPFYKKWWFFLVSGLVIFILGYLFYYAQIQSELEAVRLRARLARDLHDDVGSSLSSISIISSMATKKREHSPEDVKRIFTKISETSQKTLDSISDLVWTLDPENDLMQDLFMRMRLYTSEILEAKEIMYEFNVAQETELVKMTMDKRKNIYLIFKEALNNIVKYSKCTRVLINVKLINHTMEFEIADNGIGFIEGTGEHKGNGLKNMKQRASQLNGTLTIKSKPGEGTNIKLLFQYT
ncbi:MAG TPA: two-component regulator propeller domain-containing protein [Bacteroidia bacterium]|nr:two-component regulator propeller domain-containing protein [Bacteroidia bacterium]